MNVVAFTLRAVQLARGFGLVVTFERGWETRGNGYHGNYVGVVPHHTGTPSSITNPFPTRRMLRDGRSDLSGPLCNSAGPADGSIHIVAAQAANHAGASGGRSMGPLPVTRLFNPMAWGHEIDYAGSVPMLARQYIAATVWAHCLLQALVEYGQIRVFDPQRVRAHAETSITGKWDPGYASGRTIDMAAFRAAVTNPQEDDVSWTDKLAVPAGPNAGKEFTAGTMHAWTNYYAGDNNSRLIAIQAAVTAIANDQDITPDQLADVVDRAVAEHTPTAEQIATAIDAAQRPHIEAAVRAVLGEDNADQADAIVDELVSRLANTPIPAGS